MTHWGESLVRAPSTNKLYSIGRIYAPVRRCPAEGAYKGLLTFPRNNFDVNVTILMTKDIVHVMDAK